LIIFVDTPTETISMESSRRDLLIDMVVDWFIFEKKRNLIIFVDTPTETIPYQWRALDETFSLIWLLIGLSSKISVI